MGERDGLVRQRVHGVHPSAHAEPGRRQTVWGVDGAWGVFGGDRTNAERTDTDLALGQRAALVVLLRTVAFGQDTSLHGGPGLAGAHAPDVGQGSRIP